MTTRDARPRTIHLIDIENQVGGSSAPASDVSWFWSVYRDHAVGIRPDDHVIVAAGPRAAAAVWFALPKTGIQRLVRSGVDGADRALLDSIDLDHMARRFERLVIASGDHIFAPLALAARERGMMVQQVVGMGLPSRALSLACPTRTRIRRPSAALRRARIALAA